MEGGSPERRKLSLKGYLIELPGLSGIGGKAGLTIVCGKKMVESFRTSMARMLRPSTGITVNAVDCVLRPASRIVLQLKSSAVNEAIQIYFSIFR